MSYPSIEFVTEPANPPATGAETSHVSNEDAIAVRPGLVIIADGVTPLDRSQPPCVHGVRWFATSIAERFADLAEDRERSLRVALAGAIEDTKVAHGSGCDLDDVDAPAATISAVRQAAPDSRLRQGVIDARLREGAPEWEYLVLADAAAVFSGADLLRVIVDDRPAQTGRRMRAEGRAMPAREFRATWANRPEGYWVAKSDPEIVKQALTGSVDGAKIDRIVVASDGATRLVDTFHRYEWPEALDVIERKGLRAWIDETREAENDAPEGFRGKRHDDATIALLRPKASP